MRLDTLHTHYSGKGYKPPLLFVELVEREVAYLGLAFPTMIPRNEHVAPVVALSEMHEPPMPHADLVADRVPLRTIVAPEIPRLHALPMRQILAHRDKIGANALGHVEAKIVVRPALAATAPPTSRASRTGSLNTDHNEAPSRSGDATGSPPDHAS